MVMDLVLPTGAGRIVWRAERPLRCKQALLLPMAGAVLGGRLDRMYDDFIWRDTRINTRIIDQNLWWRKEPKESELFVFDDASVSSGSGDSEYCMSDVSAIE